MPYIGKDPRMGGGDSFCDRLNCTFTVFILALFSIIVTTRVYVGDQVYLSVCRCVGVCGEVCRYVCRCVGVCICMNVCGDVHLGLVLHHSHYQSVCWRSGLFACVCVGKCIVMCVGLFKCVCV